MKALLTKRRATQPLQLPNAGSVFRNPSEGKTAARLIQSSGLKKLERAARASPRSTPISSSTPAARPAPPTSSG